MARWELPNRADALRSSTRSDSAVLSTSSGQTDTGSDALEVRGGDDFKASYQASTASRADGETCQEESMKVSIGVGSVHGARGPFIGEAAEAHQLRRSLIAIGSTNCKSLGKGRVFISGGEGAKRGGRRADELDRLGLFEVDPGIVQPVIQGYGANVQGSIEVRSDSPTDPAAPDGHGMRSREPPGGVGWTQKGHVGQCPPALRESSYRVWGDPANGLSMLWRADQGLPRPSGKGDDLPRHIPAGHRRSKERDAQVVGWSGPTIPSRASGATWHSISASTIKPSNSDAFEIWPLQNSSQRSGSRDRQTIDNDVPKLLYVRDSAGLRRLDLVQVSF